MTNKLLPKTTECIFLGYSLQHKGYKCLDRTTGTVYISWHVRFDEQSFPFALSSSHKQSEPSQWAFVPLIAPAVDPTFSCAMQIVPPAPPTISSSSNIVVTDFPPAACPYTDGCPSDPSPSHTLAKHPMVTRTQDGTHRQWVRNDGTVRYPLSSALLAQVSSSREEPTCYTQAVRTPKLLSSMHYWKIILGL